LSQLRPAFSLYRQSLALVNGVLGDWLHRRGSPLALNMRLSGRPEVADDCRRRVCMLVHGLTETSSIWDYPQRRDVDYGALLAQCEGFSPLYVHYNTGLGLKENGERLAENLERLVDEWPVPIEQLVLIGHSMGGLIIRSACELGHADNAPCPWLQSITDCIYLGTPHLGAPLARLAQHGALWLRQQELVPLQIVGEALDVRSNGICNLTMGAWDPLAPPSLVPGIRHFAVSGSLHRRSSARTDEILGDALVPRSSARGPQTPAWGLVGQAHFPGVGHLRLAHHSDVYLQIARWCRHDAT
jgi:pimeloyl-ACP methyl ester carboxylesterase